LTPEVGDVLADLPNLRQLELSLLGTPNPSLESLPALPRLRFFSVPPVPAFELGLLAKHPRLTTIAIQDLGTQPLIPGSNFDWNDPWQRPSTLSEAVQIEQVIIQTMSVPYAEIVAERTPLPVSERLRSAIAKLPNLKAVEIRDVWGGWPAKVIEDPGIRQALAGRSDIAINPLVRNFDSLSSPFAAFCNLVVFVAIGTQLYSQFAASWSQTVPGFARPHFWVAGILLTMHIVIASMVVVNRGRIPILSALPFAAAIPSMGALIWVVVSRRPSKLAFVFPILFGGFATWMIASPVLFRGEVVEAFFNGQRPVVAIAILFVEIAIIVGAGRSALSLSRRLNEAGMDDGLGFVESMKQLQMRKLDLTDQTPLFGRRAFHSFDSRIESYLAKGNFSDRRRQWRVVEPTDWRTCLTMSLATPWVLVGIYMLTMSLMTGQSATMQSYVFNSVTVGGFSLTVATFLLAAGALSRRPVLGQEFLRPMSRAEFDSHLRGSILIELWPVAVVTLGYLVVLPSIGFFTATSWGWQVWAANPLGHAMVCLTLPVLAWSVMLLLLTIQSQFWRSVLIFSGYLLVFSLLQFSTLKFFMKDTPASGVFSLVSASMPILYVVLGVTIAFWANRRLPRVQWGASQ